MKRRLPKPDTRPKWDDPDLPCIRRYTMADGSVKTSVDPDYEQRFREYSVQASSHPDYKHDPTYNLRRKK